MACDNGLAGNGRQRAQRRWCIYLWDRAVTGDGPGTGVRQWGPCSGVGAAGRPSGQRRSEMTVAWSAGPRPLTLPTTAPGAWLGPSLARDWQAAAATLDGRLWRRRSRRRPAVGVGGLALWRDLPAHWCQAMCVHLAATTPASKCNFHQDYVCPSVPTQNGRWRDGGGRWTYPVLSAVPVKDVNERRTSLEIVYATWHIFGDVMYVCHSMRRMDRDNAQLAAIDIKALADVDTTSHCVLPRPCWF